MASKIAPNTVTKSSPPPEAQPAAQPAAPPLPAEAPVKVDVQWACKVSALDERGQPAGDLKEGATVGDKFLLSCEGPAMVLAKEKLSLEVPKDQSYALRLLETRSLSDSRGEFVATAWAAGSHKLTNPVLNDGSHRIGLGKIELNFTSVIDPKQNPESKPFPPTAPLMMPWPAYIWLSALIVVAAVVLAAWSRVSRWLRRKRLLRLLEKNPVAQQPYLHFNKELRRISRELPVSENAWSLETAKIFLNETASALRWFLARELVLPVFDRTAEQIARDLKRKDEKLHAHVRRELVITLQELEKASIALAANRPIALNDAQQILELARAVGDRIHGSKSGKGA